MNSIIKCAFLFSMNFLGKGMLFVIKQKSYIECNLQYITIVFSKGFYIFIRPFSVHCDSCIFTLSSLTHLFFVVHIFLTFVDGHRHRSALKPTEGQTSDFFRGDRYFQMGKCFKYKLNLAPCLILF